MKRLIGILSTLGLVSMFSSCGGPKEAKIDYEAIKAAKAADNVSGTINTFTVNGVSFDMVTVGGGVFVMGCTAEQGEEYEEEEKPIHQVTLSQFSIAKYEVTKALWVAVMGNETKKYEGDMNTPADNLTFDEATQFVEKLNSLTGNAFRIPSEAEWEFAARGGNKSLGYRFSGNSDIDKVAWYGANAESKSHPVGLKEPNELGIYDMCGNVIEWCNDDFEFYGIEALVNPTYTETRVSRIVRGGFYCNVESSCRISFREFFDPSMAYEFTGFRLAL